MTFVITIYVHEGIVMASDSRITLNATKKKDDKNVTQLAVGQSDTAYKTFLIQEKIGISIFGDAAIQGAPLAGFVETFISSLPSISVDAVPERLLKYFSSLSQPPKSGFIVAGYKQNNKKTPEQHVYSVDISKNSFDRVNKSVQPGAQWGGEGDVLSRLIQPVAQQTGQPNNPKYKPLPFYPVPWQFFTLQDAIDFVIYAIKTTSDSIRFLPRPKTVGGPIDVLVIKPDKAWFIQRKELHVK